MPKIITLASAILLAATASCGGARQPASPKEQPQQAVPSRADSLSASFSADSAFAYVKAQTDMGPRVPGTDAHARCARWIVSEARRHGADTIIEQRGQAVNPNDGKPLAINNILVKFNPDATNRILLVAHYDTRPTADEESDPERAARPIDGANDGGSGVAVLLELARCLGAQRPDRAVDLLFVDAEDLGISSSVGGDEDTWCLGSQYFADHLPYSSPAEMPRLAVVLDMVGGMNARFHREQFSDRYAPQIIDRIWRSAAALGYSNRFVNSPGGPILDDHLPLLRAGIPAIDIVESRADATGSFPATWHTLDDNIDNIDPTALRAVGHTMLHFIHDTPK